MLHEDSVGLYGEQAQEWKVKAKDYKTTAYSHLIFHRDFCLSQSKISVTQILWKICQNH